MNSNNKCRIDKVISLLEDREKELVAELKTDPENKHEVLELKKQVSNAIKCLNFCFNNDLVGIDTEIIDIPQEGSDSYFTEYNLIDEATANSLDEKALKANGKGIIRLNCFDLIVRRW